MQKSASRGLVQELLRSHRFTLTTLVAMLVMSLLGSGYLLLVAQPRVSDFLEMGHQARQLQIGMLEQETSMRAWLATGEERYVQRYINGRDAAADAERALLVSVEGERTDGLTSTVLSVLLARAAWEHWAHDAVTSPPSNADEVSRILAQSTTLFDAYKEVDARSVDLILSERQRAVDNQQVAMLAVLAGYLLLLAATGALALRRRQQLHDSVVAPFDRLRGMIRTLNAGDLGARVDPTGVHEIDEISDALAELADGLDRARLQATQRERRLEFLASRFELVLRIAREISGSLSVRYVSMSVTAAAADLLGASCTLWVRGEDQQFVATSRSDDPHGAAVPADLTVPDVVAKAAADARPTDGDGGRAYPLVLAGMVVGVLQVATGRPDEDTEQVLGALLSTASAALESAHLHSNARELADMDGLTQLPNRRRFEVDVDEEWQRCRRYGRPMSVVMLDLDHFKQLNDTHGHLFGDEVLRATACALATVLRSTDTAYRYGGEEFVVLLRETGLEDAEEVADRVRRAVAEATIPQAGVIVTASAGVAERVASMAHHTELVAKADAALYEAKRAGRDRVVAAAPGR